MSSAKLLISSCLLLRAALATLFVFGVPHPISGPATRLLVRNVLWCAGSSFRALKLEAYLCSLLSKKYYALLRCKIRDVVVQEEKVVLSTFAVPCEAEVLGAQSARCIPQSTQVFICVVQQFGIFRHGPMAGNRLGGIKLN